MSTGLSSVRGRVTRRDDGQLHVAVEGMATLASLSIHSARDAIALSGRVLRDLPDRKNVYLAVGDKGYYLKVLRTRWRRLGRVDRRGVREFYNLLVCAEHGFAVPQPIAAGIDALSGESFVLAREIEAGVTLDALVLDLDPGVDRSRMRALLLEVADLTKSLHGKGVFHRDYYLCHLMLGKAGGTETLFLLDVERVLLEPARRSRWRIKDLAALSSSAPGNVVSRSDRLRFLKRYLGGSFLSPRKLRGLIKRILRKEERILSHVPKKVSSEDGGWE